MGVLTSDKRIKERYPYFGIQDFQSFYGVVVMSEWPPVNIYEYPFLMRKNEEKISKGQYNLKANSGMGRALLIAEYYV